MRARGDDRPSRATPVQVAGRGDAPVDEVVARLLDRLVGATVQEGLRLTEIGAHEVRLEGERGTEDGGRAVDEGLEPASVGQLDDPAVGVVRQPGR